MTGERPFFAFLGEILLSLNNQMKNKNYKKIILSGAILIVFIFSYGIAWASEISPDNVMELVNKSRILQGLEPLKNNPVLRRVAQEKAQDMLDNKYFAHTSPDGVSPWFWFEENNYEYRYAGENLAIDFLSAEAQHEAWMESETHKHNIMNSKYKETGVAVVVGEVEGDKDSILTVQVFGTPLAYTGEKQEFLMPNDQRVSETDSGGSVLSVRNSIPESWNTEFKIPEGYSRSLSPVDEENILDLFWLIAAAIAIGVLAINPMVIIARGYRNLWEISKEKYQKARSIKIKGDDKTHQIPVH